MNFVWRANIEPGPRNVARGWQINLPQRLFQQPITRHFSRNIARFGELLDGRKTFLVAFGAVIDTRKFCFANGIFYIIVH